VGSALLVSPFSLSVLFFVSLARSPFRRSSTLSSPWNTRPSLWCLLCLITSGYISREKTEVGEVTETCFATFTLPRILLLFSPLIQSSLRHSMKSARLEIIDVLGDSSVRSIAVSSFRARQVSRSDSDGVIRKQRVRSLCVCSR